MKFADLKIGQFFIDEAFGSIWKKDSDVTGEKAVEDDSAYEIGEVDTFDLSEPVVLCDSMGQELAVA